MIEVEWLVPHRQASRSRTVLDDLVEAGLGSCPGGGVEVLSDRVHREIFSGKLSAGRVDPQRRGTVQRQAAFP